MLVDGNQIGNFKDGAIIALLSIVMVFIILFLMIVLTEIIFKFLNKDEEKETIKEVINNANEDMQEKLDVQDEDALVACLVASIEMRNTTNKNIKVLSVKEVK